MATSPLILYQGAPTRSVRIAIALDELGKLDAAKIKPVDFLKGEHLVSAGAPGGCDPSTAPAVAGRRTQRNVCRRPP